MHGLGTIKTTCTLGATESFMILAWSRRTNFGCCCVGDTSFGYDRYVSISFVLSYMYCYACLSDSISRKTVGYLSKGLPR